MNGGVMDPAGSAASAIAGIGWSLFAGGTLIFLAVMALLVIALRSRNPRASGLVWIVGGGVAFPVAVLSVLLVVSTVQGGALQATSAKNALIVGMTGKMWWWEVRYRHPATGDEIVSANELRVPVGRPIVLGLSSGDVIHSVWVPALAGKVDMVPGRTNQLMFTVEKAGTYRGQCAEYCGAQHARMALHVIALPADEFDAWLDAQARPAAQPGTTALQRGRQAFIDSRCTACHSIRGVSEEGRLAPDLTHVGSRLFLGAGTLPNSEAALARWTSHTQDIKPGVRMPSFDRLDADTLAAMAAYLHHLQ
jgi:cytochrome c oxidase subunit 2